MTKIIIRAEETEVEDVQLDGTSLQIVFNTDNSLDTLKEKFVDVTALQISNGTDVYADYSNLEYVSIIADADNTTVTLAKLTDTEQAIKDLQETVDTLTLTTLEG